MAATRIISGQLREIWQELVPQGGGPPQIITTAIHAGLPHRSRLRSTLTVTSIVGVPVVSATLIILNGFFAVQVFNAAIGTSFTWMLDIERTQSTQQALDPAYPNGVIQVVSGVLSTGGLAAPQTLAETYNIGAVDADQRMIVSTAKGGGVTIDCTDAAVTADGVSLEIRQSAAWSLPTVLSRRGDDLFGPVLVFDKARGTYPIPADVVANDFLGSMDFYGRVGGVSTLGGRIIGSVVDLVGGVNTELRFVAGPNAVLQVASMDVVAGRPRIVAAGDVVPNADNASHLGTGLKAWLDAFTYNIEVYQTLSVFKNALIDSSGVIAPVNSLEVRQSVAHSTPVVFQRNGDDAVGPTLRFDKARGTFGVPLDVIANDALGNLDFYGNAGGVPVLGARITSVCLDPVPYRTAIDFYVVPGGGISTRVWRMDSNSPGATTQLIGYGTAPAVLPDTTQTGFLGYASRRWLAVHTDTVYAYANVSLGGATPGTDADQTIVFPAAGTTEPTTTVGLVHVYAWLFDGGGAGSNLAALTITAAEPVLPAQAFADYQVGIPCRYNGKDYYLLARDMSPA